MVRIQSSGLEPYVVSGVVIQSHFLFSEESKGIEMSKFRTYETYKQLFEEVNEYNRLKKYHPSYVLLYSFLEDRINRIYKDQYKYKNKRLPSPDEMENSLFRKLLDINRLGFTIRESVLVKLKKLRERRNVVIHKALFHFDSITKEDVDELRKFGRGMDKLRKRQRELLPKPSKVDDIKLRLGYSLPSVSKMREIKNPTSYPKSNR